MEQRIDNERRSRHAPSERQRLTYSELLEDFDADTASGVLDNVIRMFPTAREPGATSSSEVQMERGLVLAQELVARLDQVNPNEHAVSAHRIRLVLAHALAIVALLEESVLQGT